MEGTVSDLAVCHAAAADNDFAAGTHLFVLHRRPRFGMEAFRFKPDLVGTVEDIDVVVVTNGSGMVDRA